MQLSLEQLVHLRLDPIRVCVELVNIGSTRATKRSKSSQFWELKRSVTALPLNG